MKWQQESYKYTSTYKLVDIAINWTEKLLNSCTEQFNFQTYDLKIIEKLPYCCNHSKEIKKEYN